MVSKFEESNIKVWEDEKFKRYMPEYDEEDIPPKEFFFNVSSTFIFSLGLGYTLPWFSWAQSQCGTSELKQRIRQRGEWWVCQDLKRNFRWM